MGKSPFSLSLDFHYKYLKLQKVTNGLHFPSPWKETRGPPRWADPGRASFARDLSREALLCSTRDFSWAAEGEQAPCWSHLQTASPRWLTHSLTGRDVGADPWEFWKGVPLMKPKVDPASTGRERGRRAASPSQATRPRDRQEPAGDERAPWFPRSCSTAPPGPARTAVLNWPGPPPRGLAAASHPPALLSYSATHNASVKMKCK